MQNGCIKASCNRGANRRTAREDDLSEWDALINKSKSHKNLLTERNSDLVRRINKKWRKEVEAKERKTQAEEERKGKDVR